MKNNKTLYRRLQRWALLPLFTLCAVLMTPQDALAVAYITGVNIKSSPGDDGYYVGGDVVKIELTWSGNVHVLSGGNTPYFTMEVGTKEYTVYHKSGNDGKHLQFEFTLGSDAASNDMDGIRLIKDSLGGDIRDVKSGLTRSALLAIGGGTFSDHKVDTIKPTVSSVEITSNSGSGKAYKTNDKIQATVNFSETVKVTGTPQLTLKIGSDTNKKANYESGDNSKKLVFAYTVASGDNDTDGIEIEANKLSLNGGTIKDVTGKSATLTHDALSADSNHKVDTTAPTVSSITITSDAGTDNTYVKDQKIQVQVTFSEKVWVSGTPQLTLKIGTSDKTADFASGYNTKNLVFEYTVADGDNDTDGISIEADKLTLNGGKITDLPGNNATLTHAALSADSNHKVATSPPTVQSVTISSTPNAVNTYKKGDAIHAKVTFSRDVVVTGTPQVTLTIGDDDKTATYTSGSGSMDLVFEYKVAAGDTDTDGVSMGANTLALGKYKTIKDTAGVNATLTHDALDDQASHKVDSTPPTVNSVGITSSTGDTKTYKKGDTIQATVTFSEKMKVTGTPQLTLKIGDADRKANWASGDGSTSLVFQYTVGGTDTDTDGISIDADQLSLNSGKITDLPGNNATLTHSALNTDSDHKVDGILPTINDGDIHFHPATGNGWYKLGETIQFKVDFSEKVWVTGTPQLDIKDITPHADYKSGDGDTDLIFEYTVAAGDEDTDGIEIEANQLSLNDGTIKDYAENPATLTHDALSPSTSYKVDGIVPTVSSLDIISTPANNTKTYTTDEKIQVQVTFSERVWVDTTNGTPQLNLNITTGDKLADYKNGSDSNKLVFEYTVVIGDEDKDGLSIDADQLTLNGGTIKDVGSNPATI